jgi:hypothetical protein
MTDALLIIMIGLLTTFFLALVKLCFQSKCESVEFCCIKVQRNVRAEIEMEEFQIQHPSNVNRSNSNEVTNNSTPNVRL